MPVRLSDGSRLTLREFDALRDIVKHQEDDSPRRVSPFFRRQAAMRDLAASGLVERMPEYGTRAMPGWRATWAGRRRYREIVEKASRASRP